MESVVDMRRSRNWEARSLHEKKMKSCLCKTILLCKMDIKNISSIFLSENTIPFLSENKSHFRWFKSPSFYLDCSKISTVCIRRKLYLRNHSDCQWQGREDVSRRSDGGQCRIPATKQWNGGIVVDRIMTSKMSMPWSLQPVTVSPYMEKGALVEGT